MLLKKAHLEKHADSWPAVRKDKNVLPRQKFERSLEFETEWFELGTNILNRHLVKRLNRNIRIFFSKFDEYDAAVSF